MTMMMMVVTTVNDRISAAAQLTIEASRGGGGGGRGQTDLPSIFLALNFCCLTDCQKIWYSCSLLVTTSFDSN